MAKIGIMGGTFNPIHNAHLVMAEEARRQFGLEEVIFMPSKNPPHKERGGIVSELHRKRMVQHAIQNHPGFIFSDMELKREGITYTKDTLEALKKDTPWNTFYFILGGDSLASLESWKNPEYVFGNCHILAACRDETDENQITYYQKKYAQKYGAKISVIEMPELSISSEMLRKKVARGDSVAYYCPKEVEWYIRFNGLYREDIPMRWENDQPSEAEILSCLSSNLKPKRYVHTLGVAMTAANLAALHDCDEKKASLAGLLHDCAKYLTSVEQIALCREYGIPLTDVELENPALIHAKLGVHFARIKYRVTDKEILSAIRFHTTGRPQMTDLEKIIYLADYMEPKRAMKCEPYSLGKVRKACFSDLDRAMYMVLTNCVEYLKSSGMPLDEMTVKAMKYYKRK